MLLGTTVFVLTCYVVLTEDKVFGTEVVYTYRAATTTLHCIEQTVFDSANWRGPPDLLTYYIYPDDLYNPALFEKRQRISVSTNLSLVINDTKLTDSGTYVCLKGNGTHIFRRTIDLLVRVTANIPNINASVKVESSRVIATEGESLTIKCTSHGGNPAPIVTLYKGSINKEVLKNTSAVSNAGDTFTVTLSYKFTPTREDDRQQLVCRSYLPSTPNAMDSKQTSVTLYLNLKPLELSLPPPDNVVTGDTVTATCNTTGSRPAADISWRYLGQTLTPSVSVLEDQASQTFTVVSVLQRHVTAADNGQIVECIVTHRALSNTLKTSRTLHVRFPVERSTSRITGNTAVEANGVNPMTLTCTTGSSNPASEIAWKNGTDSIINTNAYNNTPGSNNGTVRSQALILRPTRYDDGSTITCSVSNGILHVTDTTSAVLNLRYSPMIAIMSDINVSEGDHAILKCNASSKPVASFTWKKGSTTVAQGTGTTSYNGYDYTITTVNRTQAGTYTCTTDNQLSRTDTRQTRLTVLYPPDITVVAVNTTVKSQSTTVTCDASGVPDQYTYIEWIHAWNGQIVTRPVHLPDTRVLTLTNLSYAHSGVYTCGASNGVKGIQHGSGGLLVKSPPVIVGIAAKEITLTGQLNRPLVTAFQLYSNAGEAVVRVYRTTGTRVQVGEVHMRDVDVQLPVFLSTITTPGTEASIRIIVTDDSLFGLYDILVTNEIGAVNLTLVLQPVKPPEPPYDITIVLDHQSVDVMWISGSPNGLNQTFVIQLSTDNSTWRDISQYGGLAYRETHQKRVDDLIAGQLYYIRMVSENDLGKSAPTRIITFTTEAQKETHTGSSAGWILGGVTSGLLVIVVVAVVILFIIWRRKGLLLLGKRNSKGTVYERDEKSRTSRTSEKEETDNATTAIGTSSETSQQYETLQDTDDKRLYEQLNDNDMCDKPQTHENFGLSTYESLQRDQGSEQRTYQQLQSQGGLPTLYENMKDKTTV